MAPRPQRVFSPGSVKLDASGYGFVAVTAPSGVVWNVFLTSINTTETITLVKRPRLNLYMGKRPNRAHFVETTGSGNHDSSGSPHVLYGGESLCGQWVGGTPLSTATMVVRAMQQEL